MLRVGVGNFVKAGVGVGCFTSDSVTLVSSSDCTEATNDGPLDCIRKWQELSIHPGSWDQCLNWPMKIVGSSVVPCFHGLRNCVPVCSSWK